MISINGQVLEVTKFPDGTSQVWKLADSHFRQRSAMVDWRFESEAEIVHLAQLATLLQQHAIRGHLDIEYLPYARQDKPVANHLTFALNTFARMLNDMEWATVTLYDPHSGRALELIARSQAIYYVEETMRCAETTYSDSLCFPDAGAWEKYHPMFVGKIRCFSATKQRDQATGRLVTGKIIGDVGKRVLIVDDICDGGATFIGLADALRGAGAADVFLFVSHGLFTKGVGVLLDAGISRVFTPKGEVSRESNATG